MAYLTRKFNQTKFSALFFKDDFQKYRTDSLGSATAGYVYGRRYDVAGTNSRLTYGAMLTGQPGNGSSKFGKVQWQAFAYGQGGKDRDGLSIKKAYHYGGNVMFQKGAAERWAGLRGAVGQRRRQRFSRAKPADLIRCTAHHTAIGATWTTSMWGQAHQRVG